MRIETRSLGTLVASRGGRSLLVAAFLVLAAWLGAAIARGQLAQVALILGSATLALGFGWILRRPYLGVAAFMVYQFALPTSALEDHAVLSRLGVLLALTTLGLTVIGMLVQERRVRLKLPLTVEWLALVFVSGLTLATAINGSDRTPLGLSSWQICGEYYRSLLLATLFLLTVRRFASLDVLTRFLLGTAIAYAAYGLLPGVSGVYRGEEGPGRVTGLHHDPNYYAIYLVFPILVALTFLVRRSGRDRWLSIALVAVGGLALILSYSRGAWLSVVVGLAYLVMRDRFRWRTLAVGLAVVGTVWLLFGGAIVERFQGVGDLSASSNSLVSRLYAVNSGWRMFSSHLVAGVGLGEFKSHVMSYGDAFLHGQMQIGAHNTYIQLLAEGGLLVGGTYLAFLGALQFQLRRAARKAERLGAREATTILAFEVGLIGTLVGMSSLTLGSHYREWIFLSLAAVAIRLVAEGRLTSSGSSIAVDTEARVGEAQP